MVNQIDLIIKNLYQKYAKIIMFFSKIHIASLMPCFSIQPRIYIFISFENKRLGNVFLIEEFSKHFLFYKLLKLQLNELQSYKKHAKH